MGADLRRGLGVCYYPEHWPEDEWARDAAEMVAAGLTWVRVGEFAWSRIEPQPGQFDFDWLERAVNILGAAGLKVVMGTPTATPPRWLLDRHPDMLAHDENGQPRKFGSRRHYCFSHAGFRAESQRITTEFAKRFGPNPHVAAWQTDNEYGCHDTTRSYSPAALSAFRIWLAARYETIEALNTAWGNVFWSMEYDHFDQIDLPNLTVTEPNPAHVMAFYRFSSDQVVSFNREQVDILRAHTAAPLLHNYMGRVVEFDHYAVGADLEIATWDSYPIGFLSDRLEETPEFKARFLRQGHPDMQAFHHDLYRAVGRGRWWVIEQQPGPVNWAPYNPAPLPGMARLWAWEAFAHGAEAVCYFRWRQAAHAQEQMHAGLLTADRAPAPALAEATQVAQEIAQMPNAGTAKSRVALVFDYASCWAWEIQPQGADFDMFRLAFETYGALRRAGLSVDIIPPDCADLSGYDLVFAPGLLEISAPLQAALDAHQGLAVLGPRSNLKTGEMATKVPLGPAIPGMEATTTWVESLPPGTTVPLENGGQFAHWFEHLAGTAEVVECTTDGRAAMVQSGGKFYLAGWPDAPTFDRLVTGFCDRAGIATVAMPDGLRIRDTDTHRFFINYAPEVIEFDGETIPAAGVVWRAR